MKKLFFYRILPITIILLAGFATYRLTLQMYYWVDDWCLVYKLVFPDGRPGNCNLGSHPAYRYLETPFYFLYPFFGLNASAYFGFGLFQYILLSVFVYLFANSISKNNRLAFGTGFIFASGYFASFAMYRLTNSYQLVHTAFFIVIFSWLYYKYLKTKKIKFYIFSLLFFYLTLEFLLIRASGIALVIVSTVLIYGRWHSLMEWIKLMPFLGIFFYMFIYDPRLSTSTNDITSFIDLVVVQGHVEFFINFFATLANSLVPKPFMQNIYFWLNRELLEVSEFVLGTIALCFGFILIFVGFMNKKFKETFIVLFLLSLGFMFANWSLSTSSNVWAPTVELVFYGFWGISLLITVLFVAYLNCKKKKMVVKLMLYGLLVNVSNFIFYFIYTPNTMLDSSSRYLTPSYVGGAMVIVCLFYLFFRKSLYYLVLFSLSAYLIWLTNVESMHIVKTVSNPDKQGIALVLDSVEDVDEKTVFYVDTKEEAIYKNEILGGIPYTGIPPLFGKEGSLTFLENHSQVFSSLIRTDIDVSNLYTFYHGPEGYINTTSDFIALLQSGGEEKILKNISSNTNFETLLVNWDKGGTVGLNPSILIDGEKYSSLVPTVLSFDLVAWPLDLSSVTFPFLDASVNFDWNINQRAIAEFSPEKVYEDISSETKLKLMVLKNKIEDYLGSAKVEVNSAYESKPAIAMLDNNFKSNWESRPGAIDQVEIVVDFGYTYSFNKAVWFVHSPLSAPTEYKFLVSDNAQNWQEVKVFEDLVNYSSEEAVVNDLGEQNARYVKMVITQNYGGMGRHAVALSELWFIKSDEVNVELYQKISSCPFCYVKDLNLADSLSALERQNTKAKISWNSNKNPLYTEENSLLQSIKVDGIKHHYEIVIPPAGLYYQNIKFSDFNIPLSLKLNNVKLRSLSLEEIEIWGVYEK